MLELAVDYAWSKPDPADIAAAGYKGAVRYLSHDSGKNLTPGERDALHAHGLWILLAWETFADRALSGAAGGHADGIEAAKQAAALGYPTGCPILFAVDFDAQPAQMASVLAYEAAFGRAWESGPYGGKRVVEASKARWRWQTAAWSGSTLSTAAALYQRLRPTTGLHGSFDENVVLRADLPVWRPTVSPVPPVPQQKENVVLMVRDPGTGREYLQDNDGLHYLSLPATVVTYQKNGVPGPDDVASADLASLKGYLNP